MTIDEWREPKVHRYLSEIIIICNKEQCKLNGKLIAAMLFIPYINKVLFEDIA